MYCKQCQARAEVMVTYEGIVYCLWCFAKLYPDTAIIVVKYLTEFMRIEAELKRQSDVGLDRE